MSEEDLFLHLHKPAKRIKFGVLHTGAGNPKATARWVYEYLRKPLAQGGRWEDGSPNGGYHVFVELDGTAVFLVEDELVTYGVGTTPFDGIKNGNTLHISYAGGLNAGIISRAQVERTEKLVKQYTALYPEIEWLGHNQVSRKLCPSYSAPKFLREIGIQEKNIYDKDHYGIAATLKSPYEYLRIKGE
ncbi:N-acetylmuramoyl-L-alanine amidase [Bernardetia sp. Wsw4-3y2]|uniref:peptidoglycan recognition protein family protein n=1 Tax=Bernardetia sp. Wsw4-3y2 TaxID=3127471 RepID=UPI0030CEFB76